MTVHHNDPDKFIGNPEDFRQYHRWLLSEHRGNNIQTSPIPVRNTQLDGGPKVHVFTYISMFTYIRHVKYNVQIINSIKDPKTFLVLSS